MKRTGKMMMSKELFEDMVMLNYDLWLDMMHNAKIVIQYFAPDPLQPDILMMGCYSPYFEPVRDDNPVPMYKFTIGKNIVQKGKEFEYKDVKYYGDNIFRYTYSIKRSDNDAVVFEGK